MARTVATVDADPYPWPYDGVVDTARLALLIAGAQVAWVEASVGAAEVTARIARVAAAVRGCGGAVVHLRHGRAVVSRVAVPPRRGHPGWHLATAPVGDDLVIDAGGIDGFYASALDAELRARNVNTLVLAGFGAETAVSSTLRSANDRGYECLVLTDAVAPVDPELGARSFNSITMSGGIFGAVAPAAALLAVLPIRIPVEVAP